MEKGSSLPMWPKLDLPYGLLMKAVLAPNALVRGSVFSTLEYAGAAERPVITEPLLLATMKQYRIEQIAGVRLSQSDADVFFWLLSRIYRRGDPSGSPSTFFEHKEALAELGRKRGGKTDLLLADSLDRLGQAEFTYELHRSDDGEHPGAVDDEDAESAGKRPPSIVGRTRLLSRVERCDRLDSKYDYQVTIAAGVAVFFDRNDWVVLPNTERKQLSKEPLARGLYAFYYSHRHAYAMLPETLKKLMGRESMQNSKWLHALATALAKVKTATGWPECEVAQVGRYAGKIVVTKGVRRRRGKKVGASVSA